MPRRPPSNALATLLRVCAVLFAIGVMFAVASAAEHQPSAAGAVAAEVVEDEPPEVASPVRVADAAPAQLERALPAIESSWSSRSAPPPIVPPPER